jgi:hypothetical protein
MLADVGATHIKGARDLGPLEINIPADVGVG